MPRTTASTRDGFGQGLVEAAQQNPAVVGLCADLAESIRMQWFAEEFPERYFQVGVAEQNLVGMAAGFALADKVPFAASYAVFSPGRSWEQIRVSVCYSNLNVKLVGGHTGLTVGPDGAVHQALEDIAITRVLPNMTVVVPSDYEETRKATLALATMQGPAYLRLSRVDAPVITRPETEFTLGKGLLLREGRDVTLVACGTMVSTALQVAQALQQRRISCKVINLHTIKPLDTGLLVKAARQTGAIVTMEEHQVAGGLGSVVSEFLSEVLPVPILKLAVRDTFGESGKPADLLTKYGLSVEAGIQLTLEALAIKQVQQGTYVQQP